MAEEKYFKVELEIKAPNKEFIDKMLDRMPNADRIYDEKIVDPDEPKLECRIRYVKDWNGYGEYFLFENKWTNEEHWGLDTGYKLHDLVKDGKVVEEGALLNYQALTKVRELMNMGIPFYFSQAEE